MYNNALTNLLFKKSIIAEAASTSEAAVVEFLSVKPALAEAECDATKEAVNESLNKIMIHLNMINAQVVEEYNGREAKHYSLDELRHLNSETIDLCKYIVAERAKLTDRMHAVRR